MLRLELLPGSSTVAFLLALLAACQGKPEPTEPLRPGRGPEFVGRRSCAECHPDEERLWRGSDHDLAMQEAVDRTVLGDFDGTELTHAGVATTFFRRDGGFFVRTEGPDGALRDYEIAYTFGARPLQQCLVEFPGGRLQALSVAWDTRPEREGGQRWFQLDSEEEIAPGDPLHWTGPLHTWNHMCAECHSTNLKKGYLLEEDRYETAWSEIDARGGRHGDAAAPRLAAAR
jgi:hypothetical protein